MSYDSPRDPRLDPGAPEPPRPPYSSGLVPLVFAVAVCAAILAWVSPRVTTDRAGDTTNAGPSVQTVTPVPSPSTSPAVPTPNPTTETVPTQAP